MRAQSSHDAAVAAIYRAASGLEPWTDALGSLVSALEPLLGCQLVCVSLASRGIVFSHASLASPPEAEIEYVRAYHALDPRIPYLLGGKTGDWFFCQDHFDEAAASREPYYRDLLIPYGGRYSAAAKLHESEHETVLFAFLSRLGCGPFSDAKRRQIEAVGFHLREAVQIYLRNRQLAKAATMGSQLLERLPRAAFLVDADRRLTFANSRAEAMMQAGTPFLAASDRLRALDSALDAQLAEAVAGLAREAAERPVPSRRLVRLAGHGRAPAGAVCLTAFAPDSCMRAFGDLTQVLLTVHARGAAADADPALWEAAFDLTPAQARVAREIFLGRTPKEAARSLMISLATVKTHLLGLFEKTGTRRQAELVRTLAAIVS